MFSPAGGRITRLLDGIVGSACLRRALVLFVFASEVFGDFAFSFVCSGAGIFSMPLCVPRFTLLLALLVAQELGWDFAEAQDGVDGYEAGALAGGATSFVTRVALRSTSSSACASSDLETKSCFRCCVRRWSVVYLTI